MEDLGKLQLKPKGRRPHFFDDPTADKLLSIVMSLAGEVSVVHDECESLVRVLEQKGVLTAEELKAYIPDAGIRAERDQWRETFLENILRILHQEIEGLQNERDENYDEATDYVENN